MSYSLVPQNMQTFKALSVLQDFILWGEKKRKEKKTEEHIDTIRWTTNSSNILLESTKATHDFTTHLVLPVSVK